MMLSCSSNIARPNKRNWDGEQQRNMATFETQEKKVEEKIAFPFYTSKYKTQKDWLEKTISPQLGGKDRSAAPSNS